MQAASDGGAKLPARRSVTTIELGAMEVGHDDGNPSIRNSGGRVFAQGLFAQRAFAQRLLASCLHVAARYRQAQRLNRYSPDRRL
jgi:hypothetical protein